MPTRDYFKTMQKKTKPIASLDSKTQEFPQVN